MEKRAIELENVNMSSPWMVYYRKLEAFFEKDQDVELAFNANDNIITLRVKGAAKAEALEQLIPMEKRFGNVRIEIHVVPANVGESKVDLIARALDGNPILNNIVNVNVMGMRSAFVLFEREVVQYFNDDLSDAHGVCSTLYQELAKDIFGEQPGVFFCTDTGDKRCECCCDKD